MRPLLAVPATLLLVYRAWSRQSLTPLGIITAGLTAIAHAIHPWSLFYILLATFFLSGTAVTKVKHAYKSTLTTSSTGGILSPTTPHPRTSIQVLANSLTASIMILLHAIHLRSVSSTTPTCLPAPQTPSPKLLSLLPYGILAHYAAVTADTFSSELGILADTAPILITALPLIHRVPRGTNGGVTTTGTLAGAGGAALIALVTLPLMPFCQSWTWTQKGALAAGIIACGTAGSLLDSVLGALLQASVVDVRSGKVVEGEGGKKVIYKSSPTGASGKKENVDGGRSGRTLATGRDLLSNNGVNFAMATTMSVIGVLGAALYV